ncbi:exonuclease mut-7 homolog [Bicyclus anynana]|uniref:Exonuclease mut-7 homolog n=1 Tax=Bicyclus anynana TaxID=110368 RepID=A0A6J1MX16_BICAN|nr:exonuclease mut-7 homolog [Bicyclus anynana]
MEVDLKQLVHKDQIIKIVPSTEESLRNLGVNTDLDETVQLWFNHLKQHWKTWKKCPATDGHFNSLFQITEDPYTVALVCSVKCEEFKDSKCKTLPYYIIETLAQWAQLNGKTPTDTLKLPAFHISISQRSAQFLKLMINTYHVHTIKEIILPIVQGMIKNDNSKLASQIVIAMKLYDDIPVEDLLFPFILQDKANMIDEYLSECPKQVKPLLLFLDRLLDKNLSVKDYAQKYIEDNKVSHVKYDKIHYKPLGKLVGRLCNKFNIPVESCKNLSKNRTTGGLRYLIHQKYVENNVSSSVWDDLVKDSLQQSGCAQEFIDMLVDYDTNEALKWASHFKIPDNSLPLALKNLSLQEVPPVDENWDQENATHNFYKLPVPQNNIIFIDTAEKFYDVVTTLVNCSILSMDCEWKPSFGAVQSQVALIQIATFDYIYLIDTIILNSKQYTSFWYRFNKSVLDNAEIIKLGFGLEQDLKEIKASVNGLGSIKVKGEGFLDLSLLWKSVINLGLSLPSDSDTGGNSLTSIVQACFGVPVEKSEQCSNWELRPLRQTQINYAAIDAYVLLEIYKYLQKLCLEQHINFEEICNYVMIEKKIKTTKKNKVADRIQASVKDFQRLSKDVKILVESDLSHLLPYLRYCDIDTMATSPTTYWHDTINLALSEDRLILTSKLKLTPTVKYSQNFILDICKCTAVKDQLHKVLSSFNIIVKQSDLLNRCLNCNEKELKILSPNAVMELCKKYGASSNNKVNIRHASDNEEDDAYCDNFLSDSDGDDFCLYQPVNTKTHTAQSNSKVLSESCVTSKGAKIQYISNIQRLSTSGKPATLCENCGKLYWDEDPLLRSVWELISPLIGTSGHSGHSTT